MSAPRFLLAALLAIPLWLVLVIVLSIVAALTDDVRI
jgi:membrane protein DedA with SNARE-associated domain